MLKKNEDASEAITNGDIIKTERSVDTIEKVIDSIQPMCDIVSFTASSPPSPNSLIKSSVTYRSACWGGCPGSARRTIKRSDSEGREAERLAEEEIILQPCGVIHMGLWSDILPVEGYKGK